MRSSVVAASVTAAVVLLASGCGDHTIHQNSARVVVPSPKASPRAGVPNILLSSKAIVRSLGPANCEADGIIASLPQAVSIGHADTGVTSPTYFTDTLEFADPAQAKEFIAKSALAFAACSYARVPNNSFGGFAAVTTTRGRLEAHRMADHKTPKATVTMVLAGPLDPRANAVTLTVNP